MKKLLSAFWCGVGLVSTGFFAVCAPAKSPTAKSPTAKSPTAKSPTTKPVIPGKKSVNKTLFDFQKNSNQNEWYVVNDGVMGGVSRSQVRLTANNTAIFEGVVSLENYGGFASIRSAPRDFQLQGFHGVELRIKGDGKTYRFNVRTNLRFDGVVYQKSFVAAKGWSTVRIAFSQMWPGYHGRRLSDVGALEPEKIKNIGFLIANKQAGKFRLELDWIRAYKK